MRVSLSNISASARSVARLLAALIVLAASVAQGQQPVPVRPAPVNPPVDPGGGAGVINKGGAQPLPFDPKQLGQPGVGEAPIAGEAGSDVSPTPVDDMITFKSNYEKDVKCIKLPLNAKINIDFEDADLLSVAKFIGCITEQNFILAGGLKGKTITIMSPKPVTAYEAYRAFLAALEINQMTIVPTGKFLKIEDVGKAKQDTLPIYGPRQSVPGDERFVTRLVQLEHIGADEMSQVLMKFKTAQGDISTYPPTNTLIVTDTGVNIKRMLGLLKELDVPTGKERVWIRQVEYAQATELVDKLMQVFGEQQGAAAKASAAEAARRRLEARRAAQARGAQQPAAASAPMAGEQGLEPGAVSVSKILADERTNQLIIVANRTSYFKLDKLIRKLDVPIPGEGQIHIHYLENADADEISSTLSSLTQGGAAGGARGAGARPRTGAPAAAGAPAGAAGGAGGSAALFEGEVKITAHKETNSLVIEASLKDYLNLKKVIQRLDVRRKQVYVEAVIMEITSSKDQKLGISGSAGTTFDIDGNEVPLLFGLGGLGISSFDLQQLQKGGIAAGMQGPLVDVDPGSAARSGALSLPTFGFLIQALHSNSDVNILSTPHILTTDNEEAEIQVGKQIPYRASGVGGGLGSLASLAGLGGGLTQNAGSALGGLGGLGGLGALGALGGLGTTQYVDVDLTLKITPHINESDFVRLEIDQEIEDVESIQADLGPTTSRRKVKNTVVVKDQQPVVIGGLIRDTETEGVDKVPFLGDIPVLGYLFRKNVRTTEKKNLLMIIVPTIISDPSDLKRIHENRMQEMRDFGDQLATKKKEYMGQVDYRKKSGILQHMNSVVSRARTDRELLEKTTFDQSELDLIGPPETHDIEYDPYEAEKERRARARGAAKPAATEPAAPAPATVRPETDSIEIDPDDGP
ncbi:MAG: type II secretion system protein GspD [Myxococcales bacterium]